MAAIKYKQITDGCRAKVCNGMLYVMPQITGAGRLGDLLVST